MPSLELSRPSSHGAAVPAAPAAPRRRLQGHQLDLVCALAQHGSLRAAANALALSQSALSRQLQGLERQLRTAVFERHATGLRLTDTGERLLALAQCVGRIEEQWLHELKSGTGLLSGSVRICGFSSVLRSVVLPSLVPLLRQHPGLRLGLKSEELYLIPSRGVAGEAELFLTQVPIRLDGYTSWTIGHELNVLIEGSRLQPDVLVYIDHEPEDRFTEHYLAVVGHREPGPLRRLYLDDIYGLLDGVRAGLGRAVVPLHLFRHEAGVRPVAGMPALRVPVVLNVRSALLQVAAVRRVAETLHAEAQRFLPDDPGGIVVIDAPFAGPLHRFGQ